MVLTELRRRNVFKVATAYMVVGWVILQVASTFLESFEAPDWVFRSFTVLILLGFPLACLLAWAFEATPEGVVRTQSADSATISSTWVDYLWASVIVITLAVAAANFWQDWRGGGVGPAASLSESAATPEPATEASPVVEKRELSIAVLPFENLSADEDNAFFASGVHEDILTHLSKMGGMKVISRTSVLQYGDKGAKSVIEIGKELGVSHVMEGSVRRADDQVRITVQLIDAANDTHLWSENYDRKLENIFALQSEVAKQVAGQLHIELDSNALGRIDTIPTSSIAAYDLYLKARGKPEDERGSSEATELLEQALRNDPDFTLAHAELAERIATSVRFGQEWQTVRPQALASARRALELDALSSEAHQAMGAIHWADERYRDAELEMRTAISLNPNSASAWKALGLVLFYQGRIADARSAMHTALELDPTSVEARQALSLLYRNMDEEQSQDLLDEAMELAPESALAHMAAGMYALNKGDLISAYGHILRSANADPDNLLAINLLHFFLLNVGQYDMAESWLQRAIRVSPHSELVYQMRLNALDASYPRADKLQSEELILEREQIVEEWLVHNPKSTQAYRYRGTLLSFRGQMAEQRGDLQARGSYGEGAILALEKSLAPHRRPDGSYVYQDDSAWALSGYGANLMARDRKEEGVRVYRDVLVALEDSTPLWSELHRAVSLAALGDEDAALAALEVAYNKGWQSIWVIENYPSLVAMNNNVRYIDILARMQARNQQAYDYVSKHPATALR